MKLRLLYTSRACKELLPSYLLIIHHMIKKTIHNLIKPLENNMKRFINNSRMQMRKKSSLTKPVRLSLAEFNFYIPDLIYL